MKQNNFQIHPTLFSLDKNTFLEKLEKLKFAKILHIDFMDGTFTKKKSINFETINLVKKYNNKFEIHLMCKNPINYLEKIEKIQNIFKIIIHIEPFENIKEIEKTIIEFKKIPHIKEIFLCSNPKTNIRKIEKYLKYFLDKKQIQGIQLMSVIPGAEGQKFNFHTYKKIEILNNKFKNLTIQVDGGIKKKNSKKIIDKGAKILSIGSYISKNNNPKDIYNQLKDLINS